MFRKYYPKCRVTIDCTELFIETPSSLEVAAMCWSNYKEHYTVKFSIGITPNGYISFVSDTYGGRASDVHIVNDSGFCNHLQPYDQVMADRILGDPGRLRGGERDRRGRVRGRKGKRRTPWERTLQTPVPKIKINPISKVKS
jgi:hypothetical protein